MEAVYWVLTWACHRKCRHCYDDRFRPYVRDDLKRVVGEGQRAYRAVLNNLPDDIAFSTARRACASAVCSCLRAASF